MALQTNITEPLALLPSAQSVLYNRRCNMSRKVRYGCLYLNPSEEPVQCVEIPGLSCPARSDACACWPANDHFNVRLCGQDCSDGTTGIPAT
jgi:hypothetical protein